MSTITDWIEYDVRPRLAATVLILAVAALIFGMIWVAVDANNLSQFCSQQNYRTGIWYFRGDLYCLSRIDQTDVIVPAKELGYYR